MTGKHVTLWIFGSIVLMVIGAVGPWAKLLGATLNGLDGDGGLILVLGILAIIAAVLMARSSKRPRPRWTYIVCIIAGGLCAAIAFYDWGTLEGSFDSTVLSDAEEDFVAAAVSTGWALVLAAFASASLVVASIVGLAVRGREAPLPVEPAPTADAAP
jgi:hypothetical protein